ncbi:hypothetical protein FPOA_12265 [Fusarium poae]|uniref:Zn(2)-C6 fungal-type domain-containing protein n=1 Tax=Fusarium poae TaxID=36050 RepID=A0A1B8A9T9_FUSPO|nr:hypothetical protein FPOA_12265 [Fusarium poae]
MPISSLRRERRSHTKSFTGCSMCKRRHMRCDENFPQCRNCTKHKVTCPYQGIDSQGKPLHRILRKNTLLGRFSESLPGRPWSPEMLANVRQWKRTGVMPKGGGCIRVTLKPQLYSQDDLCFVFQAASNQHKLITMGLSKLTVISSYLPSFLPIISSSRLAMNGFLALSAHQVASVTQSQYARQKKYKYQELAIQDLRKCIAGFKEEHVGEALVASMVLLWLCEDVPTRKTFTDGILAILDTCQSIGHQPEFYHMIAHTTSKPECGKLNGLQYTIVEMKKFQKVLEEQQPEDDTMRQLQLLIALAEDLARLEPSTPADKQLELIQLLRSCNLWLPLNGLLSRRDHWSTLMINAYLYTVTLYASGQTSQASMIDQGVDLPSLLDETLQRIALIGSHAELLNNLTAIVSPL